MKVELYQQAKEKVNKPKVLSKILESFILRAAIFAISVLVIVQAAFFNPVFKSIVSNGSKLEGELLGSEAYFFIPCKMELKLMNIESCPDLEVLVNGETRDSFKENVVLLELKSGDVVELDASSILEEAVVQVSAVSENIPEILGKTMTVTDGINLVGIVKPKH